MPRLPRIGVLGLLLVLALASCAPATPGAQTQTGDTRAQAPQAATPAHTLVVTARVEPISGSPRIDQSGGTATNITTRLFAAGLAYLDDREVPQPYLAEALPQLNTDTWRVFPDGKMETVYKLRPNLVWHDGTPLTAQDFVFAQRVYVDDRSNSIFERLPQQHIDEVVAVDDRTILFRWKRPYVLAGSQGQSKTAFHPLPRHILEPTMDSDPAQIPNHSYWKADYIGLGPYRLERWEVGAFIEGSAFDRHALGRPKIDRVRFTWISDPNAALANLLAGQIDFASDAALDFQQAMVLKRDWVAQNKGNVILNTQEVRYVQIQARPEFANPKGVLDLRVRRALSHAIDKRALLEGMLEGEGVVADTIVSPDVEYYGELDRMLMKYPYDVRRTEALMAEAGYTKGADGFFTHATDGRFSPETRGPIANELQILVDSWKRAGIDAQISVTPAALATDNEYRSKFPAFAITKSSLPETTAVRKYATADVAAPENRYGGTNKGGYSHPDYDRLLDGFNNSLERSERSRFVMEMMKFASEQVSSFPLYYDLTVTAHAAQLKGPTTRSAPDSLNFWNIHEWEWR